LVKSLAAELLYLRKSWKSSRRVTPQWKMFRVHFKTCQIVFYKANVLAKRPGAMSRNARHYLAQWGSRTITTEGFPENESDGTQLQNFFC